MVLKEVDFDWAGWAIAVALTAFAGCGKGPTTYSVSGHVRFPNGRPLTGASVTFRADNDELSVRPRGQTDEDGFFELRFNQDTTGAPPGTYRVTVVEAAAEDLDAPQARSIHSKYSSFEKSGLRFTVTSGTNVFDIEVVPFEGANG